MLLFWSGFGFVLLLSYVVYIMMEAPFGVLESMFISGKKPKSKTEPPIEQTANNNKAGPDSELDSEREQPSSSQT